MAPILYTPVAKIVKTHGLTGEVVAIPANGLIFVLKQDDNVFFVPPVLGQGETTITSIRPTPKGHLVKFQGITSIEGAQSLVGRTVLLDKELTNEDFADPELTKADPFVGLKVLDEKHGDIGEVQEVIVTGANDVWVVHGQFGEVLIPVIDDVVLGYTDESQKTIRVALLEGLLPDEAEEA